MNCATGSIIDHNTRLKDGYMAKTEDVDVIIVGGGLAGLTMANALAGSNLEIALIAPATQIPDGRSTALLAHSVDYLKTLGLWEKLQSKAASMSTMRLIDNTSRLLRAPETTFKSMDIALPTFGYNILNTDLLDVLSINADEMRNLQRIEDKVSNVVENDLARVTLQNGKELTAKLVIGADGRRSYMRQCAQGGKGIATRQWRYPQTAIVLNFEHTLPHEDASNEFHNSSGPFTTVPLYEGASSLVWVVRPEDETPIVQLPTRELEREIENQMHSILGKIKIISEIQSFPLGGMRTDKMAAGRIFLIGDAAHALPPIGAQGYNLGVRDIEVLAQLVSANVNDPSAIASRYNAKRRTDVDSRTLSVDLFNRSLLSAFVPIQMLRSGGIGALKTIAPLRNFAMREGVAPGLGFKEALTGLREFASSLRPKIHS